MLKRILLFSALALVALLAVLIVRTLQFSSQQIQVPPAAPIALDGQALAMRLAQGLQFQTVSHQDPAQLDREQFLALHRYLAAQFPLVHSRLRHETVNDYSLLYTWEGTEPGRKPVVLLAHLDVVPVEPGTEGHWDYPPFAGRIAEGYVWGRGAIDDKGSVFAVLEAVETLLRAGFQPRVPVLLAFGHDEEIGGERGAQQIVALLQARGVQPEFVLDEGGVIIQGMVPGLSGPVAAIGIAEKGGASIELLVRAAGGHSSAPPPHTAVGIVSAAVERIEDDQMPVELRGATRRFFESVGPEMSFPLRLVFANLWLFGGVVKHQLTSTPATNATVRTTTAATMIDGGIKENVLPTTARAVINFRIRPGDTVDSVAEHVRRVVNDSQVEIRVLPGAREPTAEAPVDTPSFAVLTRTIREVFPDTVVAPYLTVGGTDARSYAALTKAIYRFTPIKADATDLVRVHGTNERLSVDNFAHAVQFFVQLLKNSTGSS
ncbi:MAG TPA: M20 family peptidase [Candidatus Margulisiibacteriota bacterium]|nr:M20 family peptidase [Candidatus Margulisiibacteriota bacterium]